MRKERLLLAISWLLVVSLAFAQNIVLAEGSKRPVSIDDYYEFKKTLQRGQREIEKSEKLLHHHDIHTLIPEVFQAGAERISNGQKEVGETEESKDPAAGQEAVQQSVETLSKSDNESEKPIRERRKPASKRDIREGDARTFQQHAVQDKNAIKRHSASHSSERELTHSNVLGGKERIELKPRVSYPQPDTVKYGIKMGAQIQVKLVGGATSVQLGLVRFEILEAVVGVEGVLPVGTLLFGKPFANKGSERLQVRIIKGITPDGVEFSLRGWIRGSDGMDGLVGKVVSDGQLVARSMNEAVKVAGRAALASMADDSTPVISMKSGLSNAQSEQSAESDLVVGRPEFIVQAREQQAMLEIEQTF